MEESQLNFRVGVVVLAGAIVTGILVLVFGSSPAAWLKGTYTVKVQFPRAPGVIEDTPVRKNGVRIGNVEDVVLLDEGGVELVLKIDNDRPLRRNESFRIGTSSLLGDAVLEVDKVEDPAASTELLQDGDYAPPGDVTGNPMDVIAGMEGKLEKMDDAFESIRVAGDEIASLVRSLNEAVGRNEGRLPDLFAKTELALDNFNRAMDNLDNVIGDPELQQQLRSSLEQLPRVFDEARLTLEDTRRTMAGFERVSRRAETNLANLENFTQPLGERGPQLVSNLESTLQNVDRLMTELVDFSSALNDDQGTIGLLLHDRELYDNINGAAGNIEFASRRLLPIMEDIRVFSDKIATDPRQLGVKGALDRRPSGAGLKSGSPQY